MKTLVLATVSAAALLTAGAASAQAVAADKVAPLTQLGSNTSLSSLIDQQDNNNYASATQNAAGAGNDSSVIVQTGTTGAMAASTYANQATVTQSGVGDRALVVQTQTSNSAADKSTSTVNQSGANAYAVTYQKNATGSTASVTQTNDSAGASHDKGNIFGVNGRSTVGGADAANTYAIGLNGSSLEGWATTGSGSYGASVYQTGPNQTGNITQLGHDNAALVVQQSANDYANIYQGVGDGKTGVLGNSAAISQRADAPYAEGRINQYNWNNSASIDQHDLLYTTYPDGNSFYGSDPLGGAQDKSVAQIDESGTHGTARISQSDGYSDTAYIAQSGDSDLARVTQQDTRASTARVLAQTGSSDDAFVNQHGYGRFQNADVYQYDGNAMARIDQTTYNSGGASHTDALIYQGSGSNGSFARIDQIGTTSRTTTSDLTAQTRQFGSNDWAKTTQSDTNSQAYTYQSGPTDVSYITQSGAGSNYADVQQTQARAWSSVVQNGGYNVAYVRQ